MVYTGRIVEVVTTDVKSQITEGATAGEDEIIVDELDGFFADGGQVRLTDVSGDELVEVDVAYLTVTRAADGPGGSIALEAPLDVDLTAGSEAQPLPVQSIKTAYVATSDSELPVGCVVPHTARSYRALKDGPRDPGTGERVLVDEVAGQPTVVDVVGIAPELDVEVVPSWGSEPPATAPTVTVEPFAVGAIKVSWDRLDDARTYEVFAKLTDDIDPDTDTPVAEVAGSQFVLSTLDGMLLPMGEDAAPVYVAVRGVNPNGAGPLSDTGSATAVQADAAFISALYIAALKIQAQQIEGGSITAAISMSVDGILNVGSRITIADPNAPDGKGGITIWADDEHTRVLARFHPDGNYLDGILVAQDITVIQALKLIGDASTIASGAKVKIENGVADPATAPDLSVGPIIEAQWPSPGTLTPRGITWDPDAGQWWQLLVNTSSGRYAIRAVDTDGDAVPGTLVTLPMPPGLFGSNVVDIRTIAYFGGSIYVAMLVNPTGFPYAAMAQYTTDGDYVGGVADNTDAWSRSAVGTDGVDVYFARGTAATLRMWRYIDGDLSGLPPEQFDLPATALNVSNAYAFAIGTFDTDSTDDLILFQQSDGSVKALDFDLPIAADPTYDFTVDPGSYLGWRPSHGIQSVRSNQISLWASYYPDPGEKWWAQYADTGGGNHTDASPESPGLAVPARRFVTVGLPPAPAGVTGADVFVGYGAVSPGATKKKRAEPLTGRTMTLTAGKVSGSDAIPTTNTMGGAPGELFDDFGNSWKGDGTVELPGLVIEEHDWTPVWAASTTNPVIGNGELNGGYTDIGGVVHWWAEIIDGSTTTEGNGNYTLSVPPITPSDHRWGGQGFARIGGVTYRVYAELTGGVFLLRVDPTTAGNNLRTMTHNVPAAMTTGDSVFVEGKYRKAAA